MSEPEFLVHGSEKLTRIFGYWPSFHDAEVIELHLWRGDIDPDRDRYVNPVLTTKLHLWELANETNSQGFLVKRLHTLATLRFHDVEEDIELARFNHQNAIFGLAITKRERYDGPSPSLAVEFEPIFGMGAAFKCQRAEVLDALPCNERGTVLAG